jgi:PAS domain S-box-containing protein
MAKRAKRTKDAAAASTGPGQALRKRAEELARAREPAALSAKTPEEIQRVLHELQVHQIELEMQNEALRANQLALEESRQCYYELYEFAPVGYFTLNRDGMIETLNLTACKLFDQERQALLGRRFDRCIADADRDRWHRFFMATIRQDEKREIELGLEAGYGQLSHVHLDCLPVPAANGLTSLRLTLTDISVREQMEQELRRFNRVMVGRELRMVELKQQVNALSERLGLERPYPLQFCDGKV